MAYESDRGTLIMSVATAGAAAAWLRRSTAWSIVASLGLLISNPGDMKKAAAEWHDPKMTGAADLEAIKSQLGALLTQAKENGTWEGDAYKKFSATVQDFNGLLDKAEAYRQGTGDTLDQTAEAYHAAAQFAFYTATAMGLVAAFDIAATFWPQLKVAAVVWVTGMLEKIDNVVKAVLKKKLLFVGGVATLIAVINGLQEGQRKLFWEKQALPQEHPDFSQVSLEYDSGKGLVPKIDFSMPKVPQPKGSIIPGII